MSKNKGKAYLDFYRLAAKTGDYSENELDDFKYFKKVAFRSVKPDQKLLVRNIFSPGRANVRVLGEGLHFINPAYEESILVPNPSNDIVINYKYESEQDKSDNFTFIPAIGIDSGNSNSVGMDELYCDYKIAFKLSDPIQFFYSANVLENLRADLVGVLREFVARHEKRELVSKYSTYTIDDIDPMGKLRKYDRECGIRVVSVGFDSIKESKEVIDARNKIEVERLRAEQQKAKKEAKKIETETDIERYTALAETYRKMGLSREEISYLIGVSMRGDVVKELKDSDKASVFVSMGESMPMMDPRYYFSRQGLNGGNVKALDDGKVIDVDAEEIDDSNSYGRRRR